MQLSCQVYIFNFGKNKITFFFCFCQKVKNASVEATEGNRCVIVGTNTVSRERTTDCGVTYGTVCVAYQLLAVNLVSRMRCENNRKFNTNTQEVPFDQMFFKCWPELDLFFFFFLSDYDSCPHRFRFSNYRR